jgi:hypothetical protein
MLPAGHGAPAALVLPTAQYVPPAPVQGAQLVALAAAENVPAAHSVLAVALQKLPGAHAAGCATPPAHTLPLTHATPAAEVEPAGQ